MEWPDSGPDIHRMTFNFNNRKRPFEGDALYVHPAFSGNSFGTQDGLFIGGEIGGMSGLTDLGEFNSAMAQQQAAPDTGSPDPGPTFDASTAMDGFKSGMEGRAARQDELRQGKGPLPNTASKPPSATPEADARDAAPELKDQAFGGEGAAALREAQPDFKSGPAPINRPLPTPGNQAKIGKVRPPELPQGSKINPDDIASDGGG
jgi:hypothetical protein